MSQVKKETLEQLISVRNKIEDIYKIRAVRILRRKETAEFNELYDKLGKIAEELEAQAGKQGNLCFYEYGYLSGMAIKTANPTEALIKMLAILGIAVA